MYVCGNLYLISLSLSLYLPSVPQPKTLLTAIQNGSVEMVDSILSDLCTQINTPSSATSDDPDTRGDNVSAKPVSGTGKTGLCETMDTGESTGKTGYSGGGDIEGVVGERERESKSDQIQRRKRKSEVSAEPHTRKRKKSRDERGGEGEREEPRISLAVTVEIGGKTPRKRAEFDVAVLTETGVDNCNILHVCCGGGGSVKGLSGEEMSQRKLVILDKILSCKPVRPVITRLVRSERERERESLAEGNERFEKF